MLTDYFLDSSAVVKKYVDEAGSDVVRRLLAGRDNGRFHVAHVTLVEVVAALHRRSRRGDVDARSGGRLIEDFRRELPRFAYVIEVSPTRVEEAAALAARHVLRGYDAVQLSVAMYVNTLALPEGREPITLVSADRALNIAAQAEGLHVLDPTD